MPATSFINRPGESVDIDHEHVGDVCCKILTIRRGGSVTGNVVAEEVRVAGKLTGVAFAERMWAVSGSVLRGICFAKKYRVETAAPMMMFLSDIGQSPAVAQYFESLARSSRKAMPERASDAVRAVLEKSAAQASVAEEPELDIELDFSEIDVSEPIAQEPQRAAPIIRPIAEEVAMAEPVRVERPREIPAVAPVAVKPPKPEYAPLPSLF